MQRVPRVQRPDAMDEQHLRRHLHVTQHLVDREDDALWLRRRGRRVGACGDLRVLQHVCCRRKLAAQLCPFIDLSFPRGCPRISDHGLLCSTGYYGYGYPYSGAYAGYGGYGAYGAGYGAYGAGYGYGYPYSGVR